MKIIFTPFFCAFLFYHCISQVDTLGILAEVNNLVDKSSFKPYLDKIIHSDQAYRGSDRKAALDFENLVAISGFFNKHGYPALGVAERMPESIAIIWVHTSNREIRKLAFPLVLHAFRNGDMSEKRLREYYLKTDYHHRFDNDDHLQLPLEEIYDKLGYNTGDQIPLALLLAERETVMKFEAQRKKVLARWQAAPKTKMIKTNGVMTSSTYKEPAVEIFIVNNQLYFQKLLGDDSYEPRELLTLGDKKYKFKNQETTKYFEINATGSLLYRDPENIIEEYLKVE